MAKSATEACLAGRHEECTNALAADGSVKCDCPCHEGNPYAIEYEEAA